MDTSQGFRKSDPQVVVLRDRAIAELVLMGLRVSEVTGVTLGDLLDLESPARASVLVHRKGGKEQVLPLTRDARIAVRRWVRARPEVPTSVLFIRLPFQPGRPARLHYQSVGCCLIKAYAKRAGLTLPPRKASHHLRHTAGQNMARLGMGIEEAQAFLGHSSPTVTQVYYEVSPERLQRVARRFKY